MEALGGADGRGDGAHGGEGRRVSQDAGRQRRARARREQLTRLEVAPRWLERIEGRCAHEGREWAASERGRQWRGGEEVGSRNVVERSRSVVVRGGRPSAAGVCVRIPVQRTKRIRSCRRNGSAMNDSAG